MCIWAWIKQMQDDKVLKILKGYIFPLWIYQNYQNTASMLHLGEQVTISPNTSPPYPSPHLLPPNTHTHTHNRTPSRCYWKRGGKVSAVDRTHLRGRQEEKNGNHFKVTLYSTLSSIVAGVSATVLSVKCNVVERKGRLSGKVTWVETYCLKKWGAFCYCFRRVSLSKKLSNREDCHIPGRELWKFFKPDLPTLLVRNNSDRKPRFPSWRTVRMPPWLI